MVTEDTSPPEARPAPLRAHLLGPLRLGLGDRAVAEADWPRRAERSLLLLLLATPGHRLPRERILDLLWPEARPDAARNALYKALHALRRVLEPDLRRGRASVYVEAEGELIGLSAAARPWVDADAFQAAVDRAAAAPPAARLPLLRAALALYGGDFLVDEPYADWPLARRERLRQAWEWTILELAEREREAGQPLAAAPALEALLAVDPANEAAHRALIHAYILTGQRERAKRQFERCRQALRNELGVEPSAEISALPAALDTAAAPPVPPLPVARPARIVSLPVPPTPLVGRTREVGAVQDLLLRRDVRLVTLTGAGGIGKTRLAIEAAAGLVEDFAEGVVFVSLAPLREPGLVPAAIAGALAIREEPGRPLIETLRAELGERSFLLVLDNFEHLTEAGVVVAELLAGCPGLKILVTSRQYLRLRGEHELEVSPLALPNPTRLPPPTALARVEAVALFLNGVRALKPGFALTSETAPAVAAICVRLDGLPLAIELAAARAKFFSPGELLAQLTRRLDLLTEGPRDLPARQQTLRDAIAWSHDLLGAAEQTLFRRLAVFAGGFTLEAAAAVGEAGGRAATPHPLDARLASLVDKHLLRREEADGETPRFGMLETIREFGLERLAASGDAAAARRAHAAWFAGLAEAARAAMTGPAAAAELGRLETEHDNLRAALAWATEAGEAALGLRLAVALIWFWEGRGYLAEGIGWLERALAAGDAAEPLLRAKATNGLGVLCFAQGDLGRAESWFETSLPLWRSVGDVGGEAAILNNLGNLAQLWDDDERARVLQEEALALRRRAGDKLDITTSLHNLANLAARRNDLDQAAALLDEALTLQRQLGAIRDAGYTLYSLGSLSYQRGDYCQAAVWLRESLRVRWQLGDRLNLAWCFDGLAALAALAGQAEQAARFAGVAEGLRAAIGAPPEPGEQARYAAANAAAVAALGPEGWEAAKATGKALPLAAAVAEALAEESGR